jgi:hypothetical protein
MTTPHSLTAATAAESAARLALRAPSAVNSQPWRWRVGAGGPSVGLLELCDPPSARAAAITRARLGGHRVVLMKGERR